MCCMLCILFGIPPPVVCLYTSSSRPKQEKSPLGFSFLSMKLIKSVVSFRYDFCCFAIGWRILSTNGDSFPVAPSHPIIIWSAYIGTRTLEERFELSRENHREYGLRGKNSLPVRGRFELSRVRAIGTVLFLLYASPTQAWYGVTRDRLLISQDGYRVSLAFCKANYVIITTNPWNSDYTHGLSKTTLIIIMHKVLGFPVHPFRNPPLPLPLPSQVIKASASCLNARDV